MLDIGVYTTKDTLEEKKEFADNPDFYVWWSLNSLPAKGEPDRVFFAADGVWQGYFTVEMVNGNRIFLDEWHELEEKPKRTSFRGFTYNTPGVK